MQWHIAMIPWAVNYCAQTTDAQFGADDICVMSLSGSS